MKVNSRGFVRASQIQDFGRHFLSGGDLTVFTQFLLGLGCLCLILTRLKPTCLSLGFSLGSRVPTIKLSNLLLLNNRIRQTARSANGWIDSGDSLVYQLDYLSCFLAHQDFGVVISFIRRSDKIWGLEITLNFTIFPTITLTNRMEFIWIKHKCSEYSKAIHKLVTAEQV